MIMMRIVMMMKMMMITIIINHYHLYLKGQCHAILVELQNT